MTLGGARQSPTQDFFSQDFFGLCRSTVPGELAWATPRGFWERDASRLRRARSLSVVTAGSFRDPLPNFAGSGDGGAAYGRLSSRRCLAVQGLTIMITAAGDGNRRGGRRLAARGMTAVLLLSGTSQMQAQQPAAQAVAAPAPNRLLRDRQLPPATTWQARSGSTGCTWLCSPPSRRSRSG